MLDAEKNGRRSSSRTTTATRRSTRRSRNCCWAARSGHVSRFHWFLDTSHGADYFRRWHRLRAKSGSLWVHKASHHFDLVNWWIDGEPVQVSALGSLANYGKSGPFRHTNCRSLPAQGRLCPTTGTSARARRSSSCYNKCESADGYQRDGCVFKEDIDIFDTMNAVVRYSNGVNMSYSVNTFMPVEGYYLAFNGTKGRLEVRDYERQSWDPGEETGMFVIKNFGQRVKIEVPRETEGHGGGDQRLRDLIFKKIDAPAHMRLPDSRAGAMSCLTGIAARKSIDEGRPIRIGDLVKFG